MVEQYASYEECHVNQNSALWVNKKVGWDSLKFCFRKWIKEGPEWSCKLSTFMLVALQNFVAIQTYIYTFAAIVFQPTEYCALMCESAIPDVVKTGTELIGGACLCGCEFMWNFLHRHLSEPALPGAVCT